MIPLRYKKTVAGRVTAAILRSEIDPGFVVAEGVAYKCHFIDAGCNAQKLCAEADRDFQQMRRLERGERVTVL